MCASESARCAMPLWMNSCTLSYSYAHMHAHHTHGQEEYFVWVYEKMGKREILRASGKENALHSHAIHTTSRAPFDVFYWECERERVCVSVKNECLYHGLIVWLSYFAVLCVCDSASFVSIVFNGIVCALSTTICANHIFSQTHSWNAWISKPWVLHTYGCLFLIFYRCCRLFSRLNSHKFKVNRV